MPFLGEIAALVTAFLWAGTSIMFTEATIRVGATSVNLLRMIFSVLVLGITVLIFNFDVNLSVAQITFLTLSGIIGLIVGDGSLLIAFKKIGPRISMLIYSLSPGMAALLAFIFLGEIISFWGIIGMIITIFGVAVVVLQRNEKVSGKVEICWSGILFALLGTFGQSVGLILAKEAFNMGEINGFVATLIRVLGSLVVLYPYAVFAGIFRNPIRLFKKERKAFSWIIVGAFFSTYIGITLSLIAIVYTYVGIASTLMSTVPIIMLPLAIFYYKEKLSLVSIVGAVIAVVGIAILFLK